MGAPEVELADYDRNQSIDIMEDKSWVRVFRFLWSDVTVKSGNPDEFVTMKWDYFGMSETTIFSKATWLFFNIMIDLTFLSLGVIYILFLGDHEPLDAINLVGLSFIILFVIHAAFFWYITYVPPSYSPSNVSYD